MKVLVIGAGISGCVSAWKLAQCGHDVLLVEKGRGVGGRMATRRMDGARIDHGAQFFTVQDSRMQKLVEDWQAGGLVVPWYDRIPGRDDLPTRVRFRGTQGMTSPAKALAQAFRVETGFFVDHIQKHPGGWRVTEQGSTGRAFQCDHLVITMPSVQMLELFARSEYTLDSEPMKRLRSIKHTRCLAVLGTLDRPSSLESPGTVTHPVEEIDWLSDNQVKGISPVPSFTLHASDAYSQKYWESPDEERIPPLLEVAQEKLQAKIKSWASHRWGFAKPLHTFGASHWHSKEEKLTLAGDGFGGERIEKAALSGWEAAEAILNG